MADGPRKDTGAQLRAIVPEWLARDPAVHVLRRAAAVLDERELAAAEGLGRERRVRAVLAGVAVLVLAQLVMSGLAPLSLVVAALVGALGGLAAMALGDGLVTWGIVMAAGGWAMGLALGGVLSMLLMPCLTGLVGILVGFGRDPSFRLR